MEDSRERNHCPPGMGDHGLQGRAATNYKRSIQPDQLLLSEITQQACYRFAGSANAHDHFFMGHGNALPAALCHAFSWPQNPCQRKLLQDELSALDARLKPFET